MFILVDGDDVGASLEEAIWREDVASYVQRSGELTAHFRSMADVMSEAGATVLAVGGDSVLATCEPDVLDQIVNALNWLQSSSQVRSSAGVGTSLSRAHVALRMAKVSGKSRLVTDAGVATWW